MERQRTFQTIYGTDGHCFEVGTSLETNLKDLKRADALSSLLDNKKIKLKSKQKRHIKRRRLRCFERVRNRVRDLHHKVSSWLVKSYRVILIPTFETHNMVSKAKHLHSSVCRKLLTWSHICFVFDSSPKRNTTMRKWLADKQSQPIHLELSLLGNGKCGVLNDIGSSKNFECTECGFECDRLPKQVRAARNLSYAWNLSIPTAWGKFSS